MHMTLVNERCVRVCEDPAGLYGATELGRGGAQVTCSGAGEANMMEIRAHVMAGGRGGICNHFPAPRGTRSPCLSPASASVARRLNLCHVIAHFGRFTSTHKIALKD